jgi:hypothetical protein
MEQAGKVFDIAVSLICLAIVISILFFGLSQSKGIAAAGYEAIQDKSNVRVSVEGAKWQEREIPTSAVLPILRTYSNTVSSFECEVCGSVSIGYDIGDCLYGHIGGTGYLEMREDGGDGYIAKWEGA